MSQPADAPFLTVLSDGPMQGRRIPLTGEHLVIGRAPTSDVLLDDAAVSRGHAVLHREHGSTYVQDLASTGGTSVNGSRITDPRALSPGDIVTFASVSARFDSGSGPGGPTTAGASAATAGATAGSTRADIRPDIRYDIGDQNAAAINNVARDQYYSHVQHITAQRENFLREVAATKTKARWLIWLGVLLEVAGFVAFAAPILRFMSDIADSLKSGTEPNMISPFGDSTILGMPSGLLGWAVAALGSLLMLVGIVLHVVASARRKRVDRELPLPAGTSGRTGMDSP